MLTACQKKSVIVSLNYCEVIEKSHYSVVPGELQKHTSSSAVVLQSDVSSILVNTDMSCRKHISQRTDKVFIVTVNVN